MRHGKIIFSLVILVLLAFGDSFADDVKYTDVIDLVYEWSPDGDAIQVGDYMISEFGSVWSDTGDGDVVMVGRSAIKIGGLVKVLLLNEDENGFWLADSITVFSGNGIDSAMEKLSEEKRQQVVTSQESNIAKDENKATIQQTGKPFFEDGVWKN